MAKEEINFTDQRLSKLSVTAKKRLWAYDTKQKGLAIQVTHTGAKTFKFMAWDAKRKRSTTKTIGSYPKVSITRARESARTLADDLARGIDIVGQALEDRGTPTLNQAFDRWLEKKKKKGKTSWTFDKMRYDKHIRTKFGNKVVSDISSKILESWFLNLPTKSGLSTTSANRILVIIKTVYNQELRSYPNPTTGIALNSENSRKRFLGPSELPAFFDALNHSDTPEYLRDFVILSLFTGARKANILGMRWKDLDMQLGLWTIPAAESKNRDDMTIPLIPAAKEIIEKRRQVNIKSKSPSIFVFPSPGRSKSKSGHLTDPRDAWKALLRRAGIENFKVHDLRRSLGSWQTIKGANTAIVGKTLGHKSQAATAVYSQLNLDPVRESMETAVEAMLATKNLPKKVASIKRD